MVGSRDRPEYDRVGTRELAFGAYGSLYDVGGPRGTSGAAGKGSVDTAVVGGGICWLCRRRWEELRETPLVAGAAATGRAELLGMGFAGAGCASIGRRYEAPFFE